jgi:hypothetical protein
MRRVEVSAMPSPFPGMDPYLESPSIWPDVHHELISQIRASLNQRLSDDYVARVELRVYAVGEEEPSIDLMIPDVRIEHKKAEEKSDRSNGKQTALAEPEVIPHLLDNEVKEAFLEIRNAESGVLVTIIELLSPSNKASGSNGRKSLIDKRRTTVESGVHWVEIDLLRAGSPTVGSLRRSDYRIIMYRVNQSHGRCWRFNVRDPLPAFGIPLRAGDKDVSLDLDAVFRAAYETARYGRTIDYRREPIPPLRTGDKKWADKLLRERKLR